MGAVLAARSEPSAGTLSGPSLLVVATLATATTALGGFLPSGQRLVAAMLAMAVVWAARTQRIPTGPIGAAPLVGAAALAAWAMVSATVAGSPRHALSTVGLLAGMAAVVLVCRHTTPSQRQVLAGAAVGIGVLVALSGWVGVAWRQVPLALPAQDLWRAATILAGSVALAVKWPER